MKLLYVMKQANNDNACDVLYGYAYEQIHRTFNF